MGEEEMDEELPCEPAGHGEIATGCVPSCSSLWRTFVSSSLVMQWIEDGYRLLWVLKAPRRKGTDIYSSASEHRELVSNAVDEMVADNAVTILPPGE
jgi:hypothetical protein